MKFDVITIAASVGPRSPFVYHEEVSKFEARHRGKCSQESIDKCLEKLMEWSILLML